MRSRPGLRGKNHGSSGPGVGSGPGIWRDQDQGCARAGKDQSQVIEVAGKVPRQGQVVLGLSDTELSTRAEAGSGNVLG